MKFNEEERMIKLKKMAKKEYKCFIEKSIKRYAKEGIKSGIWTKKEALKESKLNINEI